MAVLKEPPNTALQLPEATLPPRLSDVPAPPPPTNELYAPATILKPPPTVDRLQRTSTETQASWGASARTPTVPKSTCASAKKSQHARPAVRGAQVGDVTTDGGGTAPVPHTPNAGAAIKDAWRRLKQSRMLSRKQIQQEQKHPAGHDSHALGGVEGAPQQRARAPRSHVAAEAIRRSCSCAAPG